MLRYDVKPKINSRSDRIKLGHSSSGDFGLIGTLAELGRTTSIEMSFDYEHVVGIFGKRGTGKSYLMGSLAETISWASPKAPLALMSRPRGGILFDLLNIYQWMTHGQNEWNIRLFHIPGYAPPGSESKELKLRPQSITANDWCILCGVDGIREPMGQCLNEAVPIYRAGKKFSVSTLISTIESLSSAYASETIRALTQRLKSFNSLGLFDEEAEELASLCVAKTLSVILFAGVSEDVRSLYVFLILREVYESRVKESQLEKAATFANKDGNSTLGVPKMWLFVDEAQNIIPPRSSTYATELLVRFVREGRNFGLSLCFTTQQPSAIDKRILSQIDSMFCFTLTVPGDVHTVESHLKASVPERIMLAGKVLTMREAIRELGVGQCLVSSIESPRSFFMASRGRLTAHGGGEGP